MIIERLKSGVITVGQGRGFVVEGVGERLVITAAHCLPFPPAGPALVRARGAHLRAASRPPWRGAPRVGFASSIRSPTSRCSVRPTIHTPMITRR